MNKISNIGASDSSGENLEAMPHSIEAEQQLLGAILTNNDVYDRINTIVKSDENVDVVIYS